MSLSMETVTTIDLFIEEEPVCLGDALGIHSFLFFFFYLHSSLWNS